jgi:hypothetical protein
MRVLRLWEVLFTAAFLSPTPIRFPPLQGGGELGRGQTAIANRNAGEVGKPGLRHEEKERRTPVCPLPNLPRRTGEGIKLLLQLLLNASRTALASESAAANSLAACRTNLVRDTIGVPYVPVSCTPHHDWCSPHRWVACQPALRQQPPDRLRNCPRSRNEHHKLYSIIK